VTAFDDYVIAIADAVFKHGVAFHAQADGAKVLVKPVLPHGANFTAIVATGCATY
jgi:hypothetical protein